MFLPLFPVWCVQSRSCFRNLLHQAGSTCQNMLLSLKHGFQILRTSLKGGPMHLHLKDVLATRQIRSINQWSMWQDSDSMDPCESYTLMVSPCTISGKRMVAGFRTRIVCPFHELFMSTVSESPPNPYLCLWPSSAPSVFYRTMHMCMCMCFSTCM